MDHVWSSLKKWEDIWKEQVEYEENRVPDPKYVKDQEEEIVMLKKQLKAIRKAMGTISNWDRI